MTLSPDDLAAMRREAQRVLDHDFGGSARLLAESCIRLLDEVEELWAELALEHGVEPGQLYRGP